jgi:hypothetical protein
MSVRIQLPAAYLDQLFAGGGGYFAAQSLLLTNGLAYLRAAYGSGTPGVGALNVAAPWWHGPRPLAVAFTIQQGPPP